MNHLAYDAATFFLTLTTAQLRRFKRAYRVLVAANVQPDIAVEILITAHRNRYSVYPELAVRESR
jgi:hypothetical protein